MRDCDDEEKKKKNDRESRTRLWLYMQAIKFAASERSREDCEMQNMFKVWGRKRRIRLNGANVCNLVWGNKALSQGWQFCEAGEEGERCRLLVW